MFIKTLDVVRYARRQLIVFLEGHELYTLSHREILVLERIMFVIKRLQ